MNHYCSQVEANLNAEIDTKQDMVNCIGIIRAQIESMGAAFERAIINTQLPPKMRLKLLDLWTDFSDQAVSDEIDPEIACLKGEIEDMRPSYDGADRADYHARLL